MRPIRFSLHKLAMPFASAVPRESVEKWGEDFSRHVVGSGPFILKEWVGGQRIVLTKNPGYFVKGLPHLDAVVESIGVSEDLQWFKFEGGEIDVSNIPPAVFPYVMKTPRLRKQTLRIVTVTTRYLGMNCQMPPFTDERVRRAFNYAVNKPKLIAVLNGRGIVANGVMPPGLPGFDPHLGGYPYDPARARRLLEQAGLAHGFEATLWMPADQTMMILGQSVQQDLDLVGVHLSLKAIAFPPFLEAIRQPQTVPSSFPAGRPIFPTPRTSSTCCSRAGNGVRTTTPSSATRASMRCWPKPRRSAISPAATPSTIRPSELSLMTRPGSFSTIRSLMKFSSRGCMTTC